MKNIIKYVPVILIALTLNSCSNNDQTSNTDTAIVTQHAGGGQEAVQDDVSQKDVVKIAVGSPDHTTLVTALKHVEYVDDLSNAGPFTVFAPTNAAFDKLPAGTLDDLMKDDKKADLKNILEYHVAVGGYKTEYMQDGQTIGMANGQNITITMNGDKIMVNGSATIVATVPASNGIVYVIDAVLLPPAK